MSEYDQNRRSDLPEIPPGMIKKVIIGIVVLAVVLVGFSMFYTVQEQENAAILTFGEYTSTQTDAGLYFKAPFPIQKVVKLPANITQRIQIGYREVNGVITTVEEEALMITGDENIIHADAVVEWNISNIEHYLYNIEDGEEFLRNSATSAIRSVIGSRTLDFAITSGKTEIQSEVTARLMQLQEDYQTGINIRALKFQDIAPPSGEVEQAFKAVTNAREEQNTKINNARRYENERIPVARGEAQALLEGAQATKESRILRAEGDVARFNAIYTEYLLNPQVTESRLIIETLEQILPNAKIIISDGSDGTVKYLPLNELLKGSPSKTPKSNTSEPQQGGATQ